MPDDPWMTADAVRSRVPRVADVTDDDPIERLVAEFEALAERYRGVAYVRRTATHRGIPRRGVLELPDVVVHSITSVVNDADQALAFTDPDDVDFEHGCLFLRHHGWVTVTYVHGYEAPPEGLLAACAAFVGRRLANSASGTPRDVLSQNFDGGTTRYSTPDWDAGRPTGYLDIDAALNAERDHRVGA